jgi:hypothetical protein
MLSLYSIAICPPDEFVMQGRLMKQALAEKIGWFNSKNSDVHITINVFNADDSELITWKNYLAEFCRQVVPFEIVFTRTASYPNGAFYLDPDPESKILLMQMMKQFHQQAPVLTEKTSVDPHLSIARRLKPAQLKVAQQLWPDDTFFLKFHCDNIAIRKFDAKRKQYAVESRFYFS